ncbi:MAG: calcium-binding protein [Desulforhopalus sp.]
MGSVSAFANKYAVVDQYTDPASGFSGTVFRDVSDNKIYMAIRGTEPTAFSTDWPTNIADIGSDGIAIDQAIAMYNWYQRLITPVGLQAIQYIYHKEESVLGVITKPALLAPTIVTVTGSGENEGGGLVGKSDVAVTGHSLGGHLAMIMSRIAPNLVKSTLTFNAPRFDTNLALDWSTIPFPHLTLSTTALTSEGFFDLLEDAEYRDSGSSQIGNGWATSEIINTRIEGDVVSLIGDLPGASDQEQLFAESTNEGPIDAHLMPAITDSLSVYNLLAQFDSNLTLDSITGILKASSNIGEYSLESVVSSLGVLFVSDFNKRTGSEYNADRDQLYRDIKDIAAKLPEPPSQTIESFCTIDGEGNYIPLTASEINTLSHGNIAYRYALTNLNPFAVIGADYTKFNKESELDVCTSSTPDGQLSDKYLQDRTNFLVQLLYENIHDTGAKNPYDPINIDVYPNLPSYYYADLTTGKQSLNAVYSDLATKKDNYQQFIFGSSEGDPDIAGGSKEDHLYGMDGDDSLSGAGGDDYIEGGTGQDTMNGDSGNDTFFIQGDDAAYDVFNGGDDTDTILGGAEDDTIRVNNLNSSNSIEIIDGGGGVNVIAGTGSADVIDLTGITVTNIDRIEGGWGDDTIIGTADDDHIYGGENSDTLKGMADNDTLYGTKDDGSDDHMSDRLEGGEGSDTYHVGAGDIVLDSDNQGIIFFNGQQLPAGTLTQVSENQNYYENEDNSFRAILDDTTGTLSVSLGDSPYSFSIENFSSGGYGITLEEYKAIDPSELSYTWNFAGTGLTDRLWQSTAGYFGIRSWNDINNNLIQDNDEGADVSEYFYKSEADAFVMNGNDGGDYLSGWKGYDYLSGDDGDDVLVGWGDWLYSDPTFLDGGNYLDGGKGSDVLLGAAGSDYMLGGLDNDFISGVLGKDTLLGHVGDDVLAGGSDSDVLEGGDGQDILLGDAVFYSSGGSMYQGYEVTFTYFTNGCINSFITTNFYFDPYESGLNAEEVVAGDDVMDGGEGKDYLRGGFGNDTMWGGGDQDTVIGEEGNDWLFGNEGDDILMGDNGDGTGDGDDFLTGGEGNDQLQGAGGQDVLNGGAGEDVLFGGEGNDTLNGGDQADNLYGDEGEDTLDGGLDNDSLWGGADNDHLYGNDGVDTLVGEGGDDLLFGGLGNDTLLGDNGDNSGSGSDTLYGGEGDDQLQGEGGNDQLYGDDGNDSLFGQDGDDILTGGYGNDTLDGGLGNDTYIFNSGDGTDTLFDVEGSNTISFADNSEFEIMWSTVNIYGIAIYDPTGQDMVIHYGSSDYVVVINGRSSNFTFEVGNGSVYSHQDFFDQIHTYQEYSSDVDNVTGSEEGEIIYAGGG